jgi:hypothetical protein
MRVRRGASRFEEQAASDHEIVGQMRGRMQLVQGCRIAEIRDDRVCDRGADRCPGGKMRGEFSDCGRAGRGIGIVGRLQAGVEVAGRRRARHRGVRSTVRELKLVGARGGGKRRGRAGRP